MQRLFLLILSFFIVVQVPAATVPLLPGAAEVPVATTPTRAGKRPPKKLNRLQRFVLKQLIKKWKRDGEKKITEKQKKQGLWSMILGISSLVFLLTPLAIISLPAAIIAIVLGAQSSKGNGNGQAVAGIVTGAITCGIFLLAVLIIAFYFPFF